MSHQAYRLDRQLDAIREGAEARLGNQRLAMVPWQSAAKLAEFGHGIVGAYRANRYAVAAAATRTLLEEVAQLSWVAIPDDAEAQKVRATRVAVGIFRKAKAEGHPLPSDAERLLRNVRASAAKAMPSFKDQLKQLDANERKSDGKEFWVSHAGQYGMLNDVVHPGALGPDFTDPMTRELFGFNAIVYGHQYLSLGIVSAVRLSDQSARSDRAQAAYGRVQPTQQAELKRLIKPPKKKKWTKKGKQPRKRRR